MGVLRTIHRSLVAECVASCTGPAAGSNGPAGAPGSTAGPTASADASASRSPATGSTLTASPAASGPTACGVLPATGTDGYLPAAPDHHLRQSGISGTACGLCSGLSFVGCSGNRRDQCGVQDHLVGVHRLSPISANVLRARALIPFPRLAPLTQSTVSKSHLRCLRFATREVRSTDLRTVD